MERCIICDSPYVYSLGYCQDHYFEQYKKIDGQRFLIFTLNRLDWLTPKTKTALILGGDTLINDRLKELEEVITKQFMKEELIIKNY